MIGPSDDISGYHFASAGQDAAHAYLIPAVKEILKSLGINAERHRIMDLGCGNGAVVSALSQEGYGVMGVDPSEEGIALARREYPGLEFHRGSAYDPLSSLYGRFTVVISLEVVEHVYYPRRFASTLFDLVEEGGAAIVSTPYHGYWKNLALALSGKMDDHFTVLWEHGHIKFWSERTLGILLGEAGFRPITFRRVGRISPLAKSMIALALKLKC